MSGFDHYDRAGPRIPGYTCSAIDGAIGDIDSAIAALSALIGRNGQLEELRKENDALRECGVYWRETAKELSDEVDRLTSELEEAQKVAAP